MGTPHTMTQHLNLLNREPGLNCFTLPGNQGALHFSTGWRRRGRVNQAWDTSLPSRCTHSPVWKDGKDMKSTSTYVLLLDFNVLLVWPDSSVFGLHVKGLLWCTRIFHCILKQVFPRWGRGPNVIAKASLRLITLELDFPFVRWRPDNL